METFKNIVNYEELYEVSNLGNVRRKGKNSYLKFDVSPTGYCRVTLSKEGKVKKFLVHRLVLESFSTNPLNKPFVNHIDHNPLNNNLNNLMWCTASENMQHSVAAGRQLKVQKNITQLAAKANMNAALNKYSEYLNKSINGRTLLSFERKKAGSRVRIVGTFRCDNCGSIFTHNNIDDVLRKQFRDKPLYCRSCVKGKDIV